MNATPYRVKSNFVFQGRAEDLSASETNPESLSVPPVSDRIEASNSFKPTLDFGESTKTVNPLKTDPELVSLLKKLDSITKYKSFQRWKKSFLERLLPQIVTDEKQRGNIQLADEVSERVDSLLTKTFEQAQMIEKNYTNSDETTVKHTLALRELGTLLGQTTDMVNEWIPSSSQEEKRQGYTKFHLGAALIQQGFPQYVAFTCVDETLERIKQKRVATDGVIEDSSERDLAILGTTFQAYRTQVNRFNSVMADLGVYEIMKKCLEFAQAPEVEESSDDEGMEILLEGQTMDGKEECIAVDIEPDETLGTSVLLTIEAEFGIPTKEMVLSYKGKELQHQNGDGGKKMAKELGIRDGDVLKIDVRKFSLIVHSAYSPKCQNFAYVTSIRNTLHDIRLMVESDFGIMADRQRLFRGLNYTEELVEKHGSIGQYHFDDHERLLLEPSYICLRVEGSDLIDSFEVEIGLDDSTSDLLDQIALETKFPSTSFSTFSLKTNERLPTNQTIRDSKLRHDDILNVRLNLIPVTVKRKADDSVLQELILHPSKDTLGSIKDQLREVSGVDPRRQKLHYCDRLLEDDSVSVLDLDLQPNAILFVSEGPLAIISSGDIFMAFKVNIQEAPKESEYKALAKVTKSFYSKHLKEKYPNSFQTLRVACHKTLFEANLPSADYNVYVEWSLFVAFEGCDSPSRHALCNYLVTLDLTPYLAKVSKMPQRSFSKTKGVYTMHTKQHKDSGLSN
jgi:hypothetical protein